MSNTNPETVNSEPVVKRKRGRPRKVKVEDVMAQAAQAVSANVEVSTPDLDGAAKFAKETSQSPSQADYIPGTKLGDILELPEHVYDESRRISRRCTLPNEYKYAWVGGDHLMSYKLKGYRFAMYGGGVGSGFAEGGLNGTNLFERTLDGHVRQGDVFLMYTPTRNWEQLVKEDLEKVELWNQASVDMVANEGYRMGVRTFVEKDGERTYN